MTVSVYFVGMVVLCFAAEPVQRILAGLAFAVLHEAGHLAAMSALHIRPHRICLTAAGMRIERPPGLQTGFLHESLVALAGPATSLCLAGAFWLLSDKCLELCYINLGFGLFNLLPVRQLDGGRALYFLLCKRLQETTADSIVRAVSYACLFFMAALAVLVCLQKGFSLSLTIAVVYLAACC